MIKISVVGGATPPDTVVQYRRTDNLNFNLFNMSYRPNLVLATSPGAAGHSGGGGGKKNSSARVIGSAFAGVSELLLFHPVDTVAKRLMSNQSVKITGQPRQEALASLNQVRFFILLPAKSLRNGLAGDVTVGVELPVVLTGASKHL